MARRGIPVIDPRDPDAVRKALRATEENFLEIFAALTRLESQRALVPIADVQRPPDSAPVPTGITTTFNQDGSMTVELAWTYLQGARPATQTVILSKKGTAPLAPPVPWEDDVYTLPATATTARLDLPSEHNYRFGVAVARGTPNGLEVGEVQAPTANPDWADIGGVPPVLDVPGLITGEITTLGATVALVELTWVSIGGVTVTIPTWAVDTKVLLTVTVSLAITIVVAGVFDFFWRIKRGATVLYTARREQFDSTAGTSWATDVGPWMDATTATGAVTYTVEILKNDIGAANNTIVVEAGGQLTASHWSY